MGTRVAIDLDEKQGEQLAAIARLEAKTVSEVAQDAMSAYLLEDAEIRNAVAEGLAAGRRGDVEDFDEFARRMRGRMASLNPSSDA